MKAKKASVLLILLCALLIPALLLMTVRSGDHPAGIERFVAANQAALEEIAADCLRGSQTAARYKGVEIEGVFPGEHRIVQFFSGGFGLAPASTYCGFYYSEDGVPAAYQNVDVPLTPAGENRWRWSDGTDNGGVTRRITGHWFSYRAWF